MPITKAQFYTAVEERVKQMMLSIHAYLGAHRDLAFSDQEIQEALRVGRDAASQATFREALRGLDGLQAIVWGFVDGREYFAYNQDLEALWPQQ